MFVRKRSSIVMEVTISSAKLEECRKGNYTSKQISSKQPTLWRRTQLSYYRKYKKCNRHNCRVCREGSGHGPYWFSSRSVKGRTVETYIGRSLPSGIGRTQQSPLVGREEELERLRVHLLALERSQVRKRRNHTLMETPPESWVMLTGDAGIGKTRLAEETAREARRRNWAVVWCRTYIQESSIPYRLWTETLRKAVKQDLWQRQEVTKRPLVYGPLCALLSELTDLLPTALQQMPPPPEQEQLRLWESVYAVLSTICENTTLLIVFDDLQWADARSCELLTYLVRRMRNQPVMFLCTCRATELATNHPLRSLLTNPQREQAIEQIPVRPLSDTEIGQLISHLPAPVVKGVSENASGNPFFAEELARSLAANAIDITFDPKPRQLPDTIQAVLNLRLARISTKCQRLLEQGAVLANSFLFETILAMTSKGTQADEDEILDLLEEGIQANMITEEGSGINVAYHLWHPLLQTYLYERLSSARRANLHRKAARVLQTFYADNASERAAEITDHLVKGGMTSVLTSHFAEQAADRAYALSAFPDAEKYYLLTLECMEDLNPIAPREEQLHRASLLERLGESTMIEGKYEEARQLYEHALAFHPDPLAFSFLEEQQYEAQWQALLWCEVSRAWRGLGDSSKAREILKQCENVLNRTCVTAGPAWARICYQQGHIFWLEGNLVEALAMGNKALERFEALPTQFLKSKDAQVQTQTQRILHGDSVGLGRVYTLLAGVEIFLGKSTDALQHLAQALLIFEENDIKREIAIVCSNYADIYLRKSEHNQARDFLYRALKIAEEVGATLTRSIVLVNLGILAARLGNVIEAEKWYRQALDSIIQTNELFYISLFSTYIAMALIEQGKLDEAAPLLLHALKVSRSHHISPCIGFALVALGQWRLARAIATEQGTSLFTNDQQNCAKNPIEQLLLRAQTTIERALTFNGLEADAVLQGQLLLTRIALLRDQVGTAYSLAAQTCDNAFASDFVWLQAASQCLLAQTTMALGKQETAEELFHQALTTLANLGMKLEYARTLHVYATSLLEYTNESATREQALVYLREARQTFQKCSVALDLQRVECLLASLNAPAKQAR